MSTQHVKDAKFIELYIEKIVLGVGVLVLIIALFLFVVGNPFALVINGTPYADPQQAIDELDTNDDRLERGLANSNPLPKDADKVPEYLQDVLNMDGEPVFSGLKLPALASSGLTPDTIDPIPGKALVYALASPPAPTNVLHKVGPDVLDVEFNPEIVRQFFELWGGPRDPADFTMFIAEGQFEIAEWAERLQAAPPDGTTKIPPGIWTQRFGVAGVLLLRETLDPETGEWTDRQIVKPLPLQSRILPDYEASTDPQQAIEMLNQLRLAQAEIARPELPWVGDGIEFVQVVPPRGEGGLLDDEDDLGNEFGIDEALGPAEQQIKDLEEKIEALEERRRIRDERRRPDRPDRPGGRDNIDGSPGGFDGPRDGGGDRPRRDPIQQRIDQFQEQILKLQPRAEREKAERERRIELKRKREEERKAREALLNQRNPGIDLEGDDPLAGFQLNEDATVRVWAADPTMQPGETYQYKLLVSVINPLYAVPRLSPEQLSENSQRAALLPSDEEIEKMDWIGPITVEPKSRFFFTNASAGEARIDVFRRINGRLEKNTSQVKPGDSMDEFVLVDVERRNDYTGRSSFVMIYMDAEGDLHERSQAEDKGSPELRTLNDEVNDEDGPEWPLRPKDEDGGVGEDFGGPGFPGF